MTVLKDLPQVRGHRFLPAYGGRGFNPDLLKTGSAPTDDAITDMADDNDGNTAGDILTKLLADAIEQGKNYKGGRSCSVDDALWSAVENGRMHGSFMPSGEARKIHDALEESSGNRDLPGFRYPMHARRERRSLTAGAGAGSITGIFPQNTWYDALRSRLVLREAGATFLSLPGNQGGNVVIPVTETAATILWITEGQSPTSESHDVIEQIRFTPHTASCYTDITINMMKLGMPGFTDMIVEHLINGVATLIDAAGLVGPGTGG